MYEITSKVKKKNFLGGDFQKTHTTMDTYIGQPPAQMVLPAFIWGHLWDEDPVGTTGQSRH